MPAPGPAPPGRLTHRQVLTIPVGLLLGMFLASLDQTIVASAIRTIGDDLHGLSIQAWVTTAYLVTSTISTPIYGMCIGFVLVLFLRELPLRTTSALEARAAGEAASAASVQPAPAPGAGSQAQPALLALQQPGAQAGSG